MTQREVAAKLGVKASHIAYLENGRRYPSPMLLARIIKLTGTAKLRKHRRRDSVKTGEVKRRLVARFL